MHKGVFITGTDTGIGKTVCSCLLIESLNKAGLTTAAMKPVASGAEYVNGRMVNDDAIQLQKVASIKASYDAVNPYCFLPAIAPHIAAAQAGVEIKLDKIKTAFAELDRQADFVVVEGVGGWQVPLNDELMLADIPRELNLPVILVVGLRLGCINHALLTVESIHSKGMTLLAWIANGVDKEFSCIDDNIKTLTTKINAPLIAQINHNTDQNFAASSSPINISVL